MNYKKFEKPTVNSTSSLGMLIENENLCDTILLSTRFKKSRERLIFSRFLAGGLKIFPP